MKDFFLISHLSKKFLDLSMDNVFQKNVSWILNIFCILCILNPDTLTHTPRVTRSERPPSHALSANIWYLRWCGKRAILHTPHHSKKSSPAKGMNEVHKIGVSSASKGPTGDRRKSRGPVGAKVGVKTWLNVGWSTGLYTFHICGRQ